MGAQGGTYEGVIRAGVHRRGVLRFCLPNRIGPTLAVTLGIAGFGALASLTPYRSYFLILALAATLGDASGHRLRDCRPRAHEVALWGITGLVVLLATFPYYNPFLSMGLGS